MSNDSGTTDEQTDEQTGQWVHANKQTTFGKMLSELDVTRLPQTLHPEGIQYGEDPEEIFGLTTVIDALNDDGERFRVFDAGDNKLVGLRSEPDYDGAWYLFDGKYRNTTGRYGSVAEIAKTVNEFMDGAIHNTSPRHNSSKWHIVDDHSNGVDRHECEVDNCRGRYWYESPTDGEWDEGEHGGWVQTVDVAQSSCDHEHPLMDVHK
jgi:hypothetical protein